MSWFTGKLLLDTIEENAPVRYKTIKYEPASYMNAQLRKSYLLASNKCKSTGTGFTKKNVEKGTTLLHYGRSRHLIILPRKVPNEKSFWATIYERWNSGKIMLKENDKLVTSNDDICEIFNYYFINTSTTIWFDDFGVFSEHEHASNQYQEKYRLWANTWMLKLTNPFAFLMNACVGKS